MYFLCFWFLYFTFHCIESGSSNLADSSVTGEFVPPLLLPKQNTGKWRRAGVLGDFLMFIDDENMLIVSLA